MDREVLLFLLWKDYISSTCDKINEKLGEKKMPYGRLARKIIYFHACMLSYQKMLDADYVYFVKPSCVTKYWRIMEDDLKFEEEIDSTVLIEAKHVLIEQVQRFRRLVKEQAGTMSTSLRKREYSSGVKLTLIRGGRTVVEYNLTTERYAKLQACYTGDRLDEDIVKLLMRYDFYGRNKEGIDLSVGKIYIYLSQQAGPDVNMLEAFAGAINYNLQNFCSLFYDIEKFFHSRGSFFQISNLEEYDIIVANPPYITSIMENMAWKLIKFLAMKEKTPGRVGYAVVIIPDWRSEREVEEYSTLDVNEPGQYERSKTDYEAYTLLRTSVYHRTTYVVANMSYDSFFNEPQRTIRSNSLVILLSSNGKEAMPSYLSDISTIL